MNNPRVGVAVIVKNDKNEFLLGYRKSKLGYHTLLGDYQVAN
jgi:hypothetical protein